MQIYRFSADPLEEDAPRRQFAAIGTRAQEIANELSVYEIDFSDEARMIATAHRFPSLLRWMPDARSVGGDTTRSKREIEAQYGPIPRPLALG
ncbi:MAG: hypothetical protein F4X41_00425 [Chloroflexi bacterium]|nr:hypothetical protein [Chloroflexota bacterium]